MGEALAEARLRARPAASGPTRPSPSSTRRWSSGPMTGSRRRTTRPPTPSSSPSARPPASWARSGSPTRRSSRPRSPARCASGRSSRATSRRSSSPSPTTRDGAAGTVIQLAQHPALPRRIKVVSGIRRDEAEALFAPLAAPADRALRRGRPARVWYPLPRRGVRVVDGAALEKRCAKAPRVRIPPSPPRSRSDGPWRRRRLRSSLTHLGCARSGARLASLPGTAISGERGSRLGRGRLVDYGAALEMRFGATRRGFESRPLRHLRTPPWRRCVRCRLRSSLTHLRVRSLRSSAPPSPRTP